MKVIARPPSDAFRFALSDHVDRHRIDPRLARSQHTQFVSALAGTGLDVVVLSEEPGLPDAPFVSDTLLALPVPGASGPTALLVLTRPGAASRRDEVATVGAAGRRLAPGARVVEIGQPGTLDGGDVIVFGHRVAIGVSTRTNAEGAAQLAAAVEDLGYRAFLCPVANRLHLASEVTVVSSSRLIGTAAGFASLDAAGPDVAPQPEVERLVVPDGERTAANVLAAEGACFIAAGFPVTAGMLQERGERVTAVDLSQFTLADGGPTCLVALVP